MYPTNLGPENSIEIHFFILPLGIRIAEYFHSQAQQFPLAGFYHIKNNNDDLNLMYKKQQ